MVNSRNKKIGISCGVLFLIILICFPQTTQSCNSDQYRYFVFFCRDCYYKCSTCNGGGSSDCTGCPSSRYGSGGQCFCRDGYVQSGSRQCSQLNCAYSCKTCNNTVSECTSCQSTHYRTLNFPSCPCIEKYYDNGVAACASCHYSCATCNGGSQNSCQSCSSSLKRTISGGYCNCMTGYYDNSTNSEQCATCSYKCVACNSQATSCTTCGPLRVSTPNCLCQEKYYDDGSTQSCLACPYSCKTCDNTTQCTDCNSAKNRITSSTSNFCVCDTRFYDNGSSQQCQNCHTTCLTCTGASTNQCTSCNLYSFRVLSGTTCVPKSGYYQTSATLETCSKCDSRCVTCFGTSTNCTSCSSTLNRVLTSNLCLCKVGYYEDSNKKCQLCHYSCNHCTNANSCNNCTSASLRSLSASTNLCQCPQLYYDAGVQMCASCSYRCQTCSESPQLCLSCPVGSFRTLIGRNCTCNQFYYDNGSSINCIRCHYSCASCNGHPNCLTCNTTKLRVLKNNACVCQTKFYDDGVNQLCQPCLAECKTCTTGTTCSSCESTYYRALKSSLCPCIDKYYEDNVDICASCYFSCATCNGAFVNSCLSCSSSRKRTLSNGQCNCMAGYFDNSTNSEQCSTCNYRCATCSVQAENCTTCGTYRLSIPTCLCLQQYYDDGSSQACIACPYSCKTCDNATQCTACNGAKNRITSTTSNFCLCDTRYYDNGSSQTCLSCHQTCLTCTGASINQCTSCNQNSFRILSGTTCVPKTGYYQTSVTLEECSICDTRCLTCYGVSTNCTSCLQSLHRTFAANLCPCKVGYYEDSNKKCQLCHYSCQHCVNNYSCNNCSSSSLRVLSISTNFCQCPQLYYDNGVQICASCSYRCQTCYQSPQLCLSCPANSFRTLISRNCTCNQFYYDNGSSPICVRCHHSCASCNAYPTCLTCNTAKKRNFTNNACVCQAKFYDNGIVEQCQPCLHQCKTCTIGTQCTSCEGAFFRGLSSNLCPCLQHYYEQDGKCKSCLYHCSTCSNQTYCLTCNSTKHRQKNLTNDHCVCMNYFYDDKGNNQDCLPCKYTCLTCLISSTCQTCDETNSFRKLTTTKQCSCMDGYYQPTPGTVQCVKCPYHCLTCSNSTGSVKCLTCNQTKNRQMNSATGKCYCRDSYFDDGANQTCNSCPYACKTCSSLSICLSCDTTLRTLQSNWCNCFQRYYDDLKDVTCQRCDRSCSTCTASTSCSSCNATRFRQTGTGTYCDCMVKYFDDGINQQCQSCKYQCETCTNATVCRTCNPAKNRQNATSSCPCILKYYDVGSQLCLACHYTCKSCTNGSQCATCESTNFRLLDSSTKLCRCMDRYFDDGLNHQLCVPCIYSCEKCSGSATACSTCNQTAKRQKISQACPCQQHFFDDGQVQQCGVCNYTCSTCSDAVSCDTCNASKFRQHSITSDRCTCMIGYYSDLQNQHCPRCHLSCTTCFNGTACETCDQNRLRMLNNTINMFGIASEYCVCFYKHFDPSPSESCQPCHYSCEVCSASLRTNCELCNSTAKRYRNIANNTCLCPDNYFDNGVDQLCSDCDYRCKTCYERYETNCTACYPTYYFLASQNTCYVNCPQYFYNNTLNMICSSCSQYCLRCKNSQFCYECQSGKFLFLNQSSHFCLQICPDATYPNSTSKQCIFCPKGCSKCTDHMNCGDCIKDYYHDKIYKLCYECNPLCNGCTGPSQDQCLSCHYPLVLKEKKCYQLTCLIDQFIDPINGCTKCIQLFPNSLRCDLTQAKACRDNFHLVNGKCGQCESLAGYRLTSSGTCRQICGDGVKIEYQCDDGNLINGDGCSSSCTIQEGWKCDENSKCELIKPAQFTFNSVFKFGGQNRIRIWLKLSLPIRLSGKFSLTVAEVSQQFLTYQFVQNQNDIRDVWFYISYKKNIQNKQIALSYSQPRLLEQTSRMLIELNIQTEFTVQAYPPAVYYPQEKFNFYLFAKDLLKILGIVLLVLCFAIVPKKMHLHAVTLIHYPAMIFICAGLLLQGQSDFIKSTVSSLKEISFIGGFFIGQCCTVTQYFEYSSQVILSSGYVLVIIVAYWIVYALAMFYDSFFDKISKILGYLYYHIITIQLLLSCHLVYVGAKAIANSQILNEIDALNMTLSLFIIIYSVVMLGLLTSLSYYSQIKYENPDQLKSFATLNSMQLKIEEMDISEHNRYHDQDQKTQKLSVSENRLNNSQMGILVDNQLDHLSLGSSARGENSPLRSLRRSIQTIDSPKKNSIVNSQLQFGQQLQNQASFNQLERSMPSISARKQQNQIKQAQRSGKDIDVQLQKDLPFDYNSLYSKQRKNAKFFLPIFVFKIWILSFVSALGHGHPFYVYIILATTSIIFIGIMIKIRPFQSVLTNLRIIVMQVLMIALFGGCFYYSLMSSQKNYIQSIQFGVVIGCILIIGLAILFAVIQHILAWKKEIKNCVQPCLVSLRLKGHRRVYDMKPKKQVQTIKVEQIKEEQEPVQELDAFYARMMKRQRLNQIYKKQRQIK